jgi:hypothetical protein
MNDANRVRAANLLASDWGLLRQYHAMAKPIMRSRTEFTDYLAIHLGRVRSLKKLSNNDAYLVQLDQRMSDRWASVINGRTPSPEQRKLALEERPNVSAIYPRIEGVLRMLLQTLHSMHAYAVTIPPPMPSTAGWDLKPQMMHPDNAMKMINVAVDTIRMLQALDPQNAFFKSIWDQTQEMARWTRTSVHPSAEEKAKVELNRVRWEQLEDEGQKAVMNFCREFGEFCELYAAVPAQDMHAPQMDIGTSEGWEKV